MYWDNYDSGCNKYFLNLNEDDAIIEDKNSYYHENKALNVYSDDHDNASEAVNGASKQPNTNADLAELQQFALFIGQTCSGRVRKHIACCKP